MAKVLVTEPVHENGLALLKKNGFTLIPKWELNEAELASHYDSIEAIFVRIGTLTSEFMAKMPNLKIVSKFFSVLHKNASETELLELI